MTLEQTVYLMAIIAACCINTIFSFFIHECNWRDVSVIEVLVINIIATVVFYGLTDSFPG